MTTGRGLWRAPHLVETTDGEPAPTTSLRIAVIAPPWVSVPPTGYGGTESVIDTLCRGLRRAGHDVLLIATGDSTCPVERASLFESGWGIGAAAPVAELQQAAFGHDAARRWGAHLVHDHTVSGPALGAVSTEIPVVTTCHGPFESDLATVYRLMSRHVPVIAISQSQAAAAVDTTVAAVIHHGVDVEEYPWSAAGGDYALFLGRMSPDKGVGVAIDVAERAGVPLVIAAKMDEQLEHRYFEEVIRPRLGADVRFVGEVAHRERRDLLVGAACLVNPIQWNEPFGLVTIEAMASGTPVVTTPRGAMREIVTDGRTGFVRESVDDLARAVADIGTISRAACRRHVVDCFSMDVMATNHERFYRRVLSIAPAGVRP